MITWEQIYNLLGIKDFIYFTSSPAIQELLFPVKLIFILFSIFFALGVVYFLLNSSWLRYYFTEDVVEFIFWQAFGTKQIADKWKKIKRRLDSGSESEYKIAIIESEDFLLEMLDSKGFEGKSFEEIVGEASKSVLDNIDEVLQAHKIRNSIVYNPDFSITLSETKNIVSIFETAVKKVGY